MPAWAQVGPDFQKIQIKGPKNATEQYSGVTYGPIDSDDTLWRIAERYRQNKNLSIYQVMVAIYELNPDAFADNNLNHLIDGKTLMLPSERYIARVDAEDAKRKTEQDEDSWSPTMRPGATLTNLKPPKKLASEQALSAAKEELEARLSRLDQEQRSQFEALRQQFADSISNLQSLVDDNNKLYERLDNVNTEIEDLRTRIGQEGEIQQQMDQVIALQSEMLEISRQAEAERIAREEAGWDFSWLFSPITLLIASIVLTMSLLGGFAWWLLKRKQGEPQAVAEVSTPEPQLPPSELDSLSDALADELGGDESEQADDLFGEDDLLDDVLSDELEESLDDALDDALDEALEEEMKSFDDADDEMLVPEDSASDDFGEENAELDQSDLDSLFEDDGTDDILDDMEAIDLADIDEGDPEPADDADGESSEGAEADDIADALDDDLDSLLDGEALEGEDVAAAIPQVEDEEDKPEISIDELLDETDLSGGEDVEEIDTANVMEADNLDEEVIQQLDEQITQQSGAIDKAADDLLEELENRGDEGLLDHDDDATADELLAELEADLTPEAGDEGLADLGDSDDFLSDLGDQDADAQTADGGDDPDLGDALESDDDIADAIAEEFGAAIDSDGDEQSPGDVQDELADELLSELDAEDSDDTGAVADAQDAQDDLADELLSELEAEVDETPDDSEDDLQDDIADELLSELTSSVDAAEEELTDDDVAIEPDETPKSEEIQEPPPSVEDMPDFADVDFDAALDEAVTEPEGAPDPQTADIDDIAANMDSQDADTDAEPDGNTDAEGDSDSDAEHSPPEEETVAATSTDDDDSDISAADDEDISGEPGSNASAELSPLDLDELAFDPDAENTDSASLETVEDTSEVEDIDLDGAQLSAEPMSQESADITDKGNEVLGDLPELGEWMDEDAAVDMEDATPETAEASDDAQDEVLQELEASDFDDMLEDLEVKDAGDEKPDFPENPDLDLQALLDEDALDDAALDGAEGGSEQGQSAPDSGDHYVDVDALLDASLDAEEGEEKSLDLDVALEEFTGVNDDEDHIDVDKDSGEGAKLDLARAYIEIDDKGAARELLQEVIDNGSEDEQAEAQTILASLSD